jgi:hypothetical protein
MPLPTNVEVGRGVIAERPEDDQMGGISVCNVGQFDVGYDDGRRPPWSGAFASTSCREAEERSRRADHPK